MTTSSIYDNRPTCTYAGDARDSVGQIKGPGYDGRELLVVDAAEFTPPTGCYLTTLPNRWGCHDPQCGDSTWDHDCPTRPCTARAHTTGVTRVWFRYATTVDVSDPQRVAASDAATPLFDLPSWLVGAAGWVMVTCDGCGRRTRQHGITDTSKAWALCPDCLNRPDAHARIEAKRRQNRQALQ